MRNDRDRSRYPIEATAACEGGALSGPTGRDGRGTIMSEAG